MAARPPLTTVPVVAVAGWLLPGAGYLLIGQWARGLTTGATILALFVAGLLIGGVRVVEVPGFEVETGSTKYYRWSTPGLRKEDPAVIQPPAPILQAAPLSELRDKPWSVPQAMTGPVAIVAAWASVHAAGPDRSDPQNVRKYDSIVNGLAQVRPTASVVGASVQLYKSIGALSHARMNDIGSLYLSVAGLLNLMAVIDAAHRASRVPVGEPA